MGVIPFLFDERACRLGFQRWVGIDYDISPHILTAERTGSGKTVAIKEILARTILLAPTELQPVELTVIDPKGDIDFDFLRGLPRFYQGENAPQGFLDFYEDFIRRKRRKKRDKKFKNPICRRVRQSHELDRGQKRKRVGAEKALAIAHAFEVAAVLNPIGNATTIGADFRKWGER